MVTGQPSDFRNARAICRGGFILSTQRGQPALRFPSLELVSGGETYKGTGSLQADGSVVSQLAAGDRILRITGSSDPFEFSLEEAKPKD